MTGLSSGTGPAAKGAESYFWVNEKMTNKSPPGRDEKLEIFLSCDTEILSWVYCGGEACSCLCVQGSGESLEVLSIIIIYDSKGSFI